jgi:hypothetical protein
MKKWPTRKKKFASRARIYIYGRLFLGGGWFMKVDRRLKIGPVEIGPVEIRQPLNFYLAGKIAKNDWRHALVKPTRASSSPSWTLRGVISQDEVHHPWLEALYEAIEGRDHYVGPFFVADDHGCFHGSGTHGAGVGFAWCPCCEEERADVSCNVCHGPVMETGTLDPCGGAYSGLRREDLLNRCHGAIARCDVIFAWLDDPTAYGTLVELGWAHAMHKTIWIASPTFLPDLWFAYTLTKHCHIGHDEDPCAAFRRFYYSESSYVELATAELLKAVNEDDLDNQGIAWNN